MRESLTGRRVYAITAVLLVGAAALSVALLQYLAPLPPLDPDQQMLVPSSEILDRDGDLLYAINDPDTGVHQPTTLDDIPLYLRQAVIATEDATFYANPGIDLLAIARAVASNLLSGEIVSGASTITQQVARHMLMEPEERAERTLARKIREAWLAWRLTKTLSKDEILALYLNQSYFGNMAYGVQAAARCYFAKPVSELGLAESALLAGLLQAPSAYNPMTDFDAAKARQRVVLDLMVREGYLSDERADLAYHEEIALANAMTSPEAPHFVVLAVQTVCDLVGEDALRKGGLQIQTTLDLDMQRVAEDCVRRHLEALNAESEDSPGHNVHNASIVVLDPTDGAVRVMVGSPNYADSTICGAVNCALTPRQPGSAIKPITYAAAFEQGYSPATVICDVETSFLTDDGEIYVPVNYDYRFHGPVSLRQALACSYNVPAVRLLQAIGVDRFAGMAQRLGITTLSDPRRLGLALTLGSGEVSLLELTSAYACFATGGLGVKPRIIERIEDSDGRVLYSADMPERNRVLDERVAFLVTDVLADPDARAPAFGSDGPLLTSYGAAVKTGTTTDWRDNWTIGYTTEWVVGVWVGNADNEPMECVSGVTGAAPIWNSIMNALHTMPPSPFARPDGLVEATVCAGSGDLPGEACCHVRDELFLLEGVPQDVCTMHRLVQVDAATGALAGPDCPPEREVTARVTYWPAEALAWAESQGLPLPPEQFAESATRPSPGFNQVRAENSLYLRIMTPANGATYCMASDVPREYQQLEVLASAATAGYPVILLMDGTPVCTWKSPPYRAFVPLSPGRHTLSLEASGGLGTRIDGQSTVITVLPSCEN